MAMGRSSGWWDDVLDEEVHILANERWLAEAVWQEREEAGEGPASGAGRTPGGPRTFRSHEPPSRNRLGALLFHVLFLYESLGLAGQPLIFFFLLRFSANPGPTVTRMISATYQLRTPEPPPGIRM